MKKTNIQNIDTMKRGSRSVVSTILAQASIEHPFGIHSASIGTRWQPGGKLLKVAAMVCMLFALGVGQMWGDVTLYQETFGDNGTSNTAIASAKSYSASTTYFTAGHQTSAVSNYSGDSKVGKNNVAASDNDGASGNSAVWFTGPSSPAQTKTLFQVDNINISGYTSLSLKFNLYRTNGTNSNNYVTVKYTIDGGSEQTLSFTAPSNAAEWTWCTGSLSGTGSSLTIKFLHYTNGGYTMRLDDIILTGVSAGYAVTYNNGGHGTAPSSTTASSVTLSAITATGYTCTGWKANVAVTVGGSSISAGTLIANGSTATLSQATTFTAQWTAKTTTVSFNQNSGIGGQTSDKTATYGSAMPTPITCPTRDHYDFGGYYDGAGGTGTQYYTNTGASARNWDKDAATATLYAKWTEHALTNYHSRCLTVTYAAGLGSGTAPSSHEKVNPNSSITLADNTFDAPTGMEFANWSDGTNTYNEGASYTVTANTTMTAQWSYKTYTITYYDLGSTSFTGSHASGYPTTHTYNTATALKTATKDGYTFGGWFTNSACTGTALTSLGATAFTDNITLYAKWTQTVTLDKNGGSADGSTTATFNAGGPLTVTAPIRDGYSVEGYYAEAGCTNKVMTAAGALVNYSGYVSSSKWIHSGATTLYAKWTEDTHTVTVEAGANGSVDPTSVSGVGITTASGAIVASPNTGYHFDSWSIPSGVTIASGSTTSASITINATADGKTITASFAPNTNTPYTVKHYKQKLDGTYPSTPTETQNLTGTTAMSVTPAVKSYTGFTAPSTQTVTILADGSRVVEYKYTRNSYTLTWALDGGSATGGTAAGSVKYEASLTAPTVTKTGYTFSSWSPSVPATMPAANSTYTAQWTPNTNTPYTVKHYKQKLDGTYDATPDDTDNLTGTTATSVTPARKSYTGFTAPSGQTVTILADGSRVVEYKYTRNSYTLTWSTDGDPLSGSYTNGSTKYGATITAPNTPTKANYVFAAWSPTPAATMPAANTTYTATWTAAVASVTAGGSTTYYTTLASALAYAKDNNNSTITVLEDITNQTALTYNPTAANTCTLDLNNHLVKGAVSTKLLDINKTGCTFIITDNSGTKGGELYNENSGEATYYGVYVTAGTLKLQAGKVHAKNTKNDYASATTAAKKCMARGVGVASSQTFQMSGGEVEGESIYAGYGVETAGTTTISGGTIHGKTSLFTTARGIISTGSTTITGGTIKATAYTTTAQGIYVNGSTTSINSGDSVIIESKTTTSSTAYGVYVNSGTFNANTGCKLRVSVEAKTSTTYGVYVVGARTANIYAGKFNVKSTTGTAYGIYSSGTTTVHGGTFNVSTGSSTKAYGIYTDRGTVTLNNSPEFTVRAGSTTAYGVYATGLIPAKGATSRSTKTFDSSVTINGGTFTVSTGSGANAYGAVATRVSKIVLTTTNDSIPGNYARKGSIVINDGTFDVTSATTASYGVWCNSAVTANKYTGDGDNAGSVTATPTLTVSGGKFKVTSTSDANATAYAMNKDAANTNLVVEGGYYSTEKTNASSNPTIGGKYTAPKKSCNYRVFPISPALESKYNYKVAQFYTITYNKGSNGTGTVDPGYKAIGDDITITSSTFTRTGYTQTAWNTNSAGTGGTNYAFGATYSTDADLTLYPTWTANTYTVTFDREGGSGGSSSVTATYDAAMSSITAPTKTGYTFGGYWDGDGGTGTKYYNANGTSARTWNKASNTTLYAKWTANTITITWNPNGAGATVSPTSSSYTYNGATVSLPTPTRSRHAFDGWYTDASGGTQITEVGTTNKPTADVTYYAHWRELTFEVKDQAGTGTADIHLTSTNNVAVYATSACGNLITIKADNLDAISNLGGGTANKQNIQIKYLDANNGDAEVAKESSPFRLCNDGIDPANYNLADGSNINALNGLTNYSKTYSISYTPSGYGKIDHYKLQLRLQNNTTEAITITFDLYGRSLPDEFVIAAKNGDTWYALPNTLAATKEAATSITPTKILVDDPDSPTEATYAPTTTIYKGTARNSNTSNRNSIRFTNDGSHYLQTGSGVNKMWLAEGNRDDDQCWYLNSSDFSVYQLTMDPSHSPDKKMGLYGSPISMGYHSSPTSSDIYLLPVNNKYTDYPATVTEWGQHSVILAVNAGSASGAKAHVEDGTPTAKQTVTPINAAAASAKNFKVPVGSIDLADLAENEGKVLYIDWLDGSDNIIGVSSVKIPRIIASSRDMKTSGEPNKSSWAGKEVHVLPGATLTANTNSYAISPGTASIGELHIYSGATLDVTTGTLTATTLRLHSGWTRAGAKQYNTARVHIADNAALVKTTASIDYDIYEASDGQHYYPFAVPFATAVSAIDYADTYLAGFSTYGKHYGIDYYDGATRASGGNSADNWKRVASDATLQPGKGYTIVALPVKGEAIIRVPLTFDNGWTADGEKATYSAVTKNVVAVTGATGEAASSNQRNKGWYMLGVPFMSCYGAGADMYSADGSAALIGGKIVVTPGEADPYSYDDESVPYVSVPTHDFSEYIQTDITEADLRPGWSFFVQVAEEGNLTFAVSKQQTNDDPTYYAPQRQAESTPVVRTGIILSDGNKSDKTTMLISDKYSAAAYEINADLEKMFGEGYTLATYSLSGDTRLAYNAMSTTDAKGVIPIGFRAPEDGEYTFSLNPRYAEAAVERVDLIDYKTGEVTNLMMTGYHFTTERTQDDSRFALNVVPMAKVPTGVEDSDVRSQNLDVRKIILDDKMFIIRDGRMYDATGKRVTGINK